MSGHCYKRTWNLVEQGTNNYMFHVMLLLLAIYSNCGGGTSDNSDGTESLQVVVEPDQKLSAFPHEIDLRTFWD